MDHQINARKFLINLGIGRLPFSCVQTNAPPSLNPFRIMGGLGFVCAFPSPSLSLFGGLLFLLEHIIPFRPLKESRILLKATKSVEDVTG